MRKLKLIVATLVATTIGTFGFNATEAADSELVIFDWSGYDDPSFFPGYIEKHGDSPTFAFFADEEEAFQKLRQGFRADIGHPCSQSVVKWRDGGLLDPIDTARIDKWDELIPGLRDMEGFNVDGKQYVVPVDWGSTALTYRTDLVDATDAASLQSFADPKFADRISIPDNVDDAYALGMLAVGIRDWNDATDADFEAAADFLRRVHRNVRTYWADGAELAQLMTSGEVMLAWAWNETATTLQANDVPVAMKRDTAEGSTTWVCGYVKLADRPGSEDKFYDFINSWLEDRVAEYIVSAWGYGHSSQTGMDKIDQEVLASVGFDSLERYTDSTLWQAPLHHERRDKLIAEFEQIKAGF